MPCQAHQGTIVSWGYMGVLEKKTETIGKTKGLYRDYRVYIGVIIGIPEKKMETTKSKGVI